MSWNVIYTEQAERDLRDIFEYIAFSLLAPDAAKNQSKQIMDAIAALNEMPLRHQLYEKEPWHSKGMRSIPVGNYLVFFFALESENAVVVVRIMYGGRDNDYQLDDIEV